MDHKENIVLQTLGSFFRMVMDSSVREAVGTMFLSLYTAGLVFFLLALCLLLLPQLLIWQQLHRLQLGMIISAVHLPGSLSDLTYRILKDKEKHKRMLRKEIHFVVDHITSHSWCSHHDHGNHNCPRHHLQQVEGFCWFCKTKDIHRHW